MTGARRIFYRIESDSSEDEPWISKFPDWPSLNEAVLMANCLLGEPVIAIWSTPWDRPECQTLLRRLSLPSARECVREKILRDNLDFPDADSRKAAIADLYDTTMKLGK